MQIGDRVGFEGSVWVVVDFNDDTATIEQGERVQEVNIAGLFTQ